MSAGGSTPWSSAGKSAAVPPDLATFLAYWESVRARTIRVADCIPEDKMEWVAASGRWSCGDILRHLAGIERGMYAETVIGNTSRYPGHDRTLAEGSRAIRAYMDRCHAEAMEIFRSLEPAQWLGKCLTPAGAPITTWKWLRLMPEHEAHHRGQLYWLLGSLGVNTPPLYGLTEEEVRSRSSEPT